MIQYILEAFSKGGLAPARFTCCHAVSPCYPLPFSTFCIAPHDAALRTLKGIKSSAPVRRFDD